MLHDLATTEAASSGWWSVSAARWGTAGS